jgi:ATP adenylyltransferase
VKAGPGEEGIKMLLPQGTLRKKLEETTALALASGALQPIPTTFELVEEGGIVFMVRILENIARKEEDRWRREREAGQEVNPFLPYERDLFVTRLTDTHLCLLNKFNVVENHLLIVTEDFEDQDDYLTRRDFAALLAGLAEYESLGFYNGGVVAGASQRHKHLQLLPLPLADGGPAVPVEPAVMTARYRGMIGRSDSLPFRHAIVPVDPLWVRRPAESAGEMLGTFHLMLQAVGMEQRERPRSGRQSCPYNLLATREWMLLVPRSGEFFKGISVNAIGFAGGLLVRDRNELDSVKAMGPLKVLTSVAVAL